ncbi:MAG: DUF6240 domain-containing protein [Clostridium sp.]|nr:DUF6240 domain-containing protein [Clostridium sp.]
MNVQLEGIGQGNVIDNSRTISYGAARTSGTDAPSGYTLDISGAVMDNSAYAGHGRTTEDIVCDAMTTEAALQSQYLTVMSNSVSGEDFEKLTEDGFKPCETDVETAVTVVDEIKAVLAEAGTVISGYNDDIAPEVLEEITGSAARAQEITKAFHENDIPVTEENVRDVMDAVEKSRELTEPADGTVTYMVRQEMEPTVDDLYRAQHSGSADGGKQSYGYYDQNGSGYYAKRAQEYDWDALEEQIESVIRKAGLAVNEQSIAQARFLVEEGVPLTERSLNRLARLKELSYPIGEDQVIRAAAAAIADGKEAGQADVSGLGGAWQQAVYWKEQAARVSGEALEEVVRRGEPQDLRHLCAVQDEMDAQAGATAGGAGQTGNAVGVTDAADVSQTQTAGGAGNAADALQTQTAGNVGNAADVLQTGEAAQNAEIEELSARRQLEELRLQMTITANYTLIKKGFALDTTELSQLVEQLRAAESERRQKLFGGESVAENERRESLFTETVQAREKLYMAPAAFVGRIAQAESAWTLRYAADEAERLRNAYEQAGGRYETMMTQPRGDLGDSIRKAFRNVDDILWDMDLEASEENRRAVRILGYNRMEITREQIDRVKAADASVQRVVDKLTPASVLNMIREGKNPLEMSVSELEDYLNDADKEAASGQEKFSEYLYKLERADEITQEEKESYIGIYRLFRQIEKSDGAVIGSLVNQNAELTMRNLLSAVRTGKQKGLDLTVSDNYGALREIARTDITIDRQIMSAYEEQLCRSIYDSLEPAALHEMDLNENPTMEQLLAGLREAQAESDVKEKTEAQERQYRGEQLSEIREAAEIGEEQIRFLLDAKQPVSVNHLVAAQAMRRNRNGAFAKLYELSDDTAHAETSEEARRNFRQAAEDLRDSLTDAGAAGAAYQAFAEAGMELLEQQGFADGTYVDVKAYQLIGKQLSLAVGMTREEQYHIPVEIDGQVTALTVKIRHGEEVQGQVAVAMEHESFGKAGVELEMTSVSDVSGYLAYSSQGGEQVLTALEERFRERLAGEGLTLQAFHSIYSSEVNPDNIVSHSAKQNGQQIQVRTSVLYTVARSFVAAMQDTAVGRKEQNEI